MFFYFDFELHWNTAAWVPLLTNLIQFDLVCHSKSSFTFVCLKISGLFNDFSLG